MSRPQLEESAGFDRQTLDYIQRAAASGLYEIRGLGAKRRVPNFDDLLFLGASLSRYPLEGYRERCTTKTVLGARFASKPITPAASCWILSSSSGVLLVFLNDWWPFTMVATDASSTRIAAVMR